MERCLGGSTHGQRDLEEAAGSCGVYEGCNRPEERVMSGAPPQLFLHPESFKMEEVQEVEQETRHEHGPDCGHEAVQHGDHIDYKVEGKHHFLHGGKWWKH